MTQRRGGALSGRWARADGSEESRRALNDSTLEEKNRANAGRFYDTLRSLGLFMPDRGIKRAVSLQAPCFFHRPSARPDCLANGTCSFHARSVWPSRDNSSDNSIKLVDEGDTFLRRAADLAAARIPARWIKN